MASMHRAPSNSKKRLMQAARQLDETSFGPSDRKTNRFLRFFETTNNYNLYNRPEDCPNLYSFQWGLTNLRFIL
jgi:hypothetical protein